MEIKPNVIIYFPFGAAGNLVANIFSLDTNFMFFDDSEYFQDYPIQEDRYNFIKKYYQLDVNNDTWLSREWTIRIKPMQHFYLNNSIAYWDPKYRIAYLIHGSFEETAPILLNKNLRHWDQTNVTAGRVAKCESPWTLQECDHIFILPNNIDTITNIYLSKHQSDPFDQTHQAYDDNRCLVDHLTDTKNFLLKMNRRVYSYTAEELFHDSGHLLINSMVNQVGAEIPANYIKEIHSIWLRSTRTLYYNTFNKELKL